MSATSDGGRSDRGQTPLQGLGSIPHPVVVRHGLLATYLTQTLSALALDACLSDPNLAPSLVIIYSHERTYPPRTTAPDGC